MPDESDERTIARIAERIRDCVRNIVAAGTTFIIQGFGDLVNLLDTALELSKHLRELAEFLNRFRRNIRVVKLYGSFVGLFGGAVAATGAVLAIPTGGLTLPLAGTGLMIAGAGGVMSCLASFAEFIIDVVSSLADLQAFIQNLQIELPRIIVNAGQHATRLAEGVRLPSAGWILTRDNIGNLTGVSGWEALSRLGSGCRQVGGAVCNGDYLKLARWGAEAVGTKVFLCNLAAMPVNYFDFVNTAAQLRNERDLSACTKGLVKIAEYMDFTRRRAD